MSKKVSRGSAGEYQGYETMQIEKGYHHLTYKGIEVDIIRATAASGYKLHLLSAGDPFTVKDIMEYDSDRLAIVGAVNANYFTILWWFLPYIHMNQPWVYMCSPS